MKKIGQNEDQRVGYRKANLTSAKGRASASEKVCCGEWERPGQGAEYHPSGLMSMEGFLERACRAR